MNNYKIQCFEYSLHIYFNVLPGIYLLGNFNSLLVLSIMLTYLLLLNYISKLTCFLLI